MNSWLVWHLWSGLQKKQRGVPEAFRGVAHVYRSLLLEASINRVKSAATRPAFKASKRSGPWCSCPCMLSLPRLPTSVATLRDRQRGQLYETGLTGELHGHGRPRCWRPVGHRSCGQVPMTSLHAAHV